MVNFSQQVTLAAVDVVTNTASATDLAVTAWTTTTVDLQLKAPLTGATGQSYTFTCQYARACDWTLTTVNMGSSVLNPGAAATFTISNLVPHTHYKFRVRTGSGRYSPFIYWNTNATDGSADQPDGTFIVDVGLTITGQGGHTWSLNEVANPFAVITDGDVSTSQGIDVIYMVYHNKQIYVENKDGLWFVRTLPADTWTQTATVPRVGWPARGPLPAYYITTASPQNSALVYHGGVLLDGAQIQHVFWGPDWTTNRVSASALTSVMTDLWAGSYFNGLAEYMLFTKPTVLPSLLYTASTPPNFSTLSRADPTLVNFLTGLFDAGTLIAPNTDSNLYMVVLPPSAGNFSNTGGAHGSFYYQGNVIQYGVAYGIDSGGSSLLNNYTTVLAHETVEAMTDGGSGFYGVGAPAPVAAWTGPGPALTNIGGTEAEDYTGSFVTISGAVVGGYYSNRARAIIAATPPPDQTVTNTASATGLFTWGATGTSMNLQLNAPATGAAGQQYTFTCQYARGCDTTLTTVGMGTRALNPGDAAAFTISNLVPHTYYKFRVRTNSGRYSPFVYVNTNDTNGVGDQPDGMTVFSPGQTITGQGGHTWSLYITANAYGVITDGDASTLQGIDVIYMCYHNRQVFVENKDGFWFVRTLPSDTWTQTAVSPRLGAPIRGPLPATYTTTASVQNSAMLYLGGVILDAARVQYIFWGPDWNTNRVTPATLTTLMTNLWAGPYPNGLKEYWIFTPPTVLPSLTYTASTPPNFSNLTSADATLVTFLTGLFDNGTLVAPNFDSHYFMVMLPPSAGNLSGTGGAHGCFYYQGNVIYYGVGYGIDNGGSTLQNNYTLVMCHETVECITDSGNGFYGNGTPNPQLGWAGPGPGSTPQAIQGEEAEDIAGSTVTISGCVVGGYYSNRARAVIAATS